MKKSTTFFVALFICFFTHMHLSAQLSGTFSIPGTHTSIAAMISEMNMYGVNGAVTVNIAAGYTETAIQGGYVLNDVAGTSASNTIIFQKSGNGANPLILAYAGGTATPASALQDGVWRFIGSDYITIDGIDISDPNTSNPATMEFGYGFFKAGGTNGCQHNTIKNCVITLKRTNNAAGTGQVVSGSRGIELINAGYTAHTTIVSVTVSAGANSHNRFYSNLIQNCNYGIAVCGYTATNSSNWDVNNDIGGMSAVTGNTIINYGGGGTLPASGIFTRGQYSVNISNNIVNNHNGGGVLHLGDLYGIHNGVCQSANASINNNTLTVKGGTTCLQSNAIQNDAGNSPNNNTVTISGNLITGCTSTPSAAGFDFIGIYNTGASDFLTITGNSFTSNSLTISSSLVSLITNSAAIKSGVEISGNNLTFTLSGTATGTFNVISHNSGTATPNQRINNNSFSGFTSPGTIPVKFINTAGNSGSMELNNNTWNNISWGSSGSVNLIHNHSNFTSTLSVSGNSIITGFTKTAASGAFVCYNGTYSLASSGQMTVTGNNFSNITSSVAGSGNFTGMDLSEGAGTSPYHYKEVYGNVVSNIVYNTSGSCTGIRVAGLGTSTSLDPSVVHHNTITAVTLSATTSTFLFGLHISGNCTPLGGPCTSYMPPEIYSNQVNNLIAYANNVELCGIYSDVKTDLVRLYSNKVANLDCSNNADGMLLNGPTEYQVYNNLVGAIKAKDITGIIFNYYGTQEAWNNTIYLDGATESAACLKSVFYTNLKSKNNLLVNLCTSTVSTGTVSALFIDGYTNYSDSSDNNLFYIASTATNAGVAQISNTVYTTLANLKSASGLRDLNSVTENVVFASTTWSTSNYLSPNTASATLVESGAVTLSLVTHDYHTTLRNIASPDIGAVEGNFIPVSSESVAPNVNSFGFSTPHCGTSSRTFSAVLGDASGIASGSLAPRLYYKVNNGTYTFATGTLASGTPSLGLWDFVMNFSALPDDVISYYLAIQDGATTPNLTTVPPVFNPGVSVASITNTPAAYTYSVRQSLNGTYTVGTSGTFTSLTQAANAYNKGCLTGPVTFVLTNSVYSSPSESMPITFERNADANATNSLLIVPAAGVTPTISNNPMDSAVIRFFAAKHITIDGLNSSGSGLNIFSYSSVKPCANIWLTTGGNSNFWFNSDYYTRGNSYITLRNLTIDAGVTNTVSTGILSTSRTHQYDKWHYGSYNNDFISIEQNTITSVYYGIQVMGQTTVDAFGACNNWTIKNNQVGPAVSSANNPALGIYVFNCRDLEISGNLISNITSTTEDVIGLHVGGGMNNSLIERNTIRRVKCGAGDKSTGLIIESTGGGDVTVQNNMIADIGYTSIYLGNDVRGIQSSGSGIKYLNNTIALTQGTTVAANIFGYFVDVFGIDFLPGSKNIDLRNNIIFSNIYNYNFSSGHLLYCPDGAGIFNNIDYNNYYITGNSTTYLAKIGNQNIYELTGLKQSAGQNQHSIDFKPVFTSSVDAHLDPNAPENYYLDNTALSVAGITVDVDNQSRSPISPDVGADEFTASASCATASAGYVSLTSSCGGPQELFTNTLAGGVGIVNQWQVSTSAAGIYTNVSSGSGFNSPTYTIGGFAPGTYYFRLENTCPTASLSSLSNTVTVNVPANFSLSAPPFVCSGKNAIINASGADQYFWSDGTTSSPKTIFSPTAAISLDLTYYIYGCPPATVENIVIYVQPSPTVAISASSTSLCLGNAVNLSAGGASTYTWSTGAVSAAIVATPTSNTSYTVTGESANGCTHSASVTINVLPAPSLTLGPSAYICSGQTATLTAAGASNYTWTSGALTSSTTVNPSVTTVYTVTGKNAGVCTALGTVTVFVVPAFTVNISGPNSICSGETISLTASGASSYSWNTGALTQNITEAPTTTTVYVVTGMASGCGVSASKTITVNQPPALSINGNTIACIGQSSQLIASGAATYTWDNGSNSATLAISQSVTTSYTLSGTSVAGCQSQMTISVSSGTLPVIGISSSAFTVCPSSPVSFTASGANTYTWSNSTVGNTTTVSPFANTVYTVNGTNGVGCTSSQTIGIATFSIPVISVSPFSPTVCVNTPVTFSASGASTYTWNGSSVGSTVTLVPSGSIVYQVNGTSSDGCNNTAFFPVTVNASPVISVNPPAATVCAGSSVSFTANGASTYTWNGSIASQTITFLPFGNAVYSVSATDVQGCTGNATVGVTSASLPAISVNSSSAVVCANSSVTFTASGANSYTWSHGPTVNPVTINPPSGAIYTVTGASANGCLNTATVGVNIFSLPVINVSPPSATVCANKPVNFSASGASTFTWSGGSNGASVTYTPSASVFYQLSGTSAQGCIATVFFGVTANPNPTISISPPAASVCLGDAVNFTASGASTFTWNGVIPGSSVNFIPSGNTTYSVAGTGTNGCSSTAIVGVTSNSIPVININPASSTACPFVSGTLSANGASSYTWNTGASGSQLSVSPSVTTVYTATGTSAEGCLSLPASATVNVLPASATSITASSPSVCAGETVTLSASGATTYVWHTGTSIITNTTSIVVSPVSGNTYSLLGVGANGCAATTSTIAITLFTVPQVSISGTNALCAGGSATLGAQVSGASSYSWNTGSSAPLLTVSPVNQTTYTLTAYTANGCVNTAMHTLSVNTLPLISISGNTSLCQGSNGTITASGAISYSWSSGQSANSITVAAGTYSVVGADANGCKNSATITVALLALPLVSATASSTLECSNTPIVLQGAGASTYTWTGGVTNGAAFYPGVSGSYVVTGTSTNGCTGTATIFISVKPSPTVSISGDKPVICEGDSVAMTGSGATKYLWNGGDTLQVILVKPVLTTSYTLTGTDPNGCADTALYVVTVSDCSGLHENHDGFAIGVYPNPGYGEFVIELSQLTADLQVEIYTSLGQLIRLEKITSTHHLVRLSDEAKGVYTLRITDQQRLTHHTKIVKQ